MKIILFFLIVSLVSCKQTQGKKFFNYDQIDYYYDKDKEIFSIVKDENNFNGLPSIQNSQYGNYLIKDGYKIYHVDQSKFNEVDDIFIEKEIFEPVFSKCMPIYRDVLVFKKKGKIIGIAEICFTCGQNIINGTHANTENFGQKGDYEKLEKILLKVRNKNN